MKKNIIISLLFVFLITGSLFAQKDTTKIGGMVYSFVPQFLINKGIRIDVEKQITPRSFIQICPQFYLGESKQNSPSDYYYDDNYFSDNDRFNNLTGYGLNIYHKIFSNADFLSKGVYLSYGFSYSYFDIDYYDNYLDEIINANGKIQKYGIDFLIGYQLFLKNKLSLDIYTGFGTRISNMDTNGPTTNRFNSKSFGYNYEGNLMHLGLRLGLIL